jgi:hypothetical protein
MQEGFGSPHQTIILLKITSQGGNRRTDKRLQEKSHTDVQRRGQKYDWSFIQHLLKPTVHAISQCWDGCKLYGKDLGGRQGVMSGVLSLLDPPRHGR